jgi:hypothetical protein
VDDFAASPEPRPRIGCRGARRPWANCIVSQDTKHKASRSTVAWRAQSARSVPYRPPPAVSRNFPAHFRPLTRSAVAPRDPRVRRYADARRQGPGCGRQFARKYRAQDSTAPAPPFRADPRGVLVNTSRSAAALCALRRADALRIRLLRVETSLFLGAEPG